MRTNLGRWRIEERGETANICFNYGPNSFNPVTGRRGGTWNCWSAAWVLVSDEIVEGDPLRLVAQDQRPYPQPLPREISVSLTEVTQALGYGPLRARNKTFDPDR